jgi:hypothetical protein
MFQHSANLLDGDAGEPLDKLSDLRSIFEVLEQCGYRDARPHEHPRTTYALGLALNGRARGPIDHRRMLPLLDQDG